VQLKIIQSWLMRGHADPCARAVQRNGRALHQPEVPGCGLDLVASSIYDCGCPGTNSTELDCYMIDRSPDEAKYPSSPNNGLIWYLIVSLPGTVILILGAGAYALSSPAGFLIGATLWTLLSPGMWVFPIVSCRQVYNLASGIFVPISGNTYICVAILLGLYLWWALAAKFLIDMPG
jgi:hypothetical protein